MSDDASSDADASGHTDGWYVGAQPTSGSTPRIADPVPHSRLVGLMAEPVSRSVPLRRSTVLMLLAFFGFGTLSYLYPPNSPTTASPVTGTFIPVVTTPTTHPATTTTTSRPGAETSTTSTTTTTTRPISTTTTSTTASVGSTTTAAPQGPTTTTTTTLGTSTTTTPAP